jgi:hypothetical protein
MGLICFAWLMCMNNAIKILAYIRISQITGIFEGSLSTICIPLNHEMDIRFSFGGNSYAVAAISVQPM